MFDKLFQVHPGVVGGLTLRHLENTLKFMIDRALLTAENFCEKKSEPLDGAQWIELIAGNLVVLDPPNEAHGTTLLNLSKALAESIQQSRKGYACFELGLIVLRDPDTVLVPAVSLFIGGNQFAESDKVITETRPVLVVEIASTNKRRHDMQDRMDLYLDWGVQIVWIIDPEEKQVHCIQKDTPTRPLSADEVLIGSPVLPEFKIRVEGLFAEPEWWGA